MPVKYDLTLVPTEESDIPDGDGYYLYDTLFAPYAEDFSTLSVSMLMDGPFHRGEEPHTKRVEADHKYTLRASVTDEAEVDALDAVLEPYVENGESISLDGLDFEVHDAQRTHESFTELFNVGQSYEAPELEFRYKTPTCIVHPRSTITEMFPHRRGVFPQLAAKWNNAIDDETFKMAIDPFAVGANVFEKPRADTYRTYSTLTDIRENEDGTETPFFRQGFIGTCSYAFRKADRDFTENIVALARFAEYAGVGADTHHGCGCVAVDISDRGGR